MDKHPEPFQVYKVYLAVKNHFNTNYDYVTYKGRITGKKATFEERRDRYFFEKLSRKIWEDELLSFMVSNFVRNPSYSIVDLCSEECLAEHRDWIKRVSKLDSTLQDEFINILKFLNENDLSFNSLTDCSGGHPLIVKFYLQDMIYPETLLMFEKLYHIIQRIDESLSFDPIWKGIRIMIEKYLRFMNMDKYKGPLYQLVDEWTSRETHPIHRNEKTHLWV